MPEGQLVVSARINVKTLAEVAQFLSRQGEQPQSRSHIVRRATEVVAEASKQEEISTEVDTVKQAVEILEGYGITFEESKKTSSELAQAISTESLSEASTEDASSLEEIIEAKKGEGAVEDKDEPISPSDILSD